MPRFHYKAVAANGEILEGEMDAPSQTIAIDRIQSAGHLPISAEERSSPFKSTGDSLFATLFPRKRVTFRDIGILTRELATLLHAGLPLDNALRTLEELSDKAPIKSQVQDIHARVQGGAPLSDAMEAQRDVFSHLYLNTIRAGEASGALDIVLARLADYLDRSADLRSSVKSALIYPSILVVVAIISVLALLIFVVPQFVPLFEDVGQALPVLTQIVFGTAEFIRQYWWAVLGIIAAVIWVGHKQLEDPNKRLRWHTWSLRVPLFGELITKLEVARFARTLGTLLINGVPLLTGVSIVREVLTNRTLANVMDEVSASLEQGRSLAEPLMKSGHFPQLAVRLIQVGEETGQLEAMLLKIADVYDNESQTTIKRLLTLLEPVLILGVGAVIAVIIISILIAMLGLNELVI
ncbi:MAG: type II secretion system F family protein [Gammaproteobacteria bacterium]|nr:type II secretion system F family protein [Gammaproteobacteria bacterium]